MASSIKLAVLSKDLNMKSKDIIDILASEFKIDKKTGATLDAEEFELLLYKLTESHQIKNLDGYLSGDVKLGCVRAEKAKEAAPERKEAPAKSEPVKSESAKSEPVKGENAKSEPVKSESAPAKREEPKAAPAGEVHKAPEARRSEGDRATSQRSEQRGERRGDRAPFPQGERNGERRGDRNGDRGQRQGGYQRYSDSTSFDPFEKRRENMQKNAEGRRAPQQRDGARPQDGDRFKTPAQPRPAEANRPEVKKPEAVAPVSTPSQDRPAQLAALEKQRQAEQKAKEAAQQKAEPKKPVEKKEEKRAQRQQFKTVTPITPATEIKGGVNIISDYEETVTPSRARGVSISNPDVDLSKYDERYSEKYHAIANGTESRASKQKLKKQDNRGQNQKSARDKERAAQEKIKRMEAEKARKKQLEITVPDEITVGELAIRLKKTSAEVIKKLLMMGEMKTINDVIDYGTAELIADEFGAKVTKEIIVTKEEKLFTEAEDNEADLIERAPVVCVMGHVDHGKTSILDAIRHTNVTRGEAGGITQAIGAYRVKAQGKDITFLDTPGHEAFTAMRMRGAKSTDIAILVVAADDGVMPQTVEAINHAKAAGIDIVVAINKMDKPQANPDNVLNQLTQYELVPEDWGGDVICVPVSAHTGMGIDTLLESVLLVAEVKELKANPTRRAKGLVIESRLDKGRGPVATVLVQNGTLHQGDYVIVGNAVGRVRAMLDDKGKPTKVAGPSVPVEIVGLDDVPQAGDELNAVEDERMAKALAEERREKQRQEILNANARVNLDDLFSQISEGTKSLNIIVKADVAGSSEAVKASLLKLSNEEVKVSVIHTAVGGITESDVMLATASNAIIVGFNVRPDKNALDSAERNGVDIRTHRIIYEIIDEVEAALKGMLAPTFKEVVLGHAEVRQTIKVPGVGVIAGCYIKDGKITRQSSIRIVRDGIVIFEDKISSLRRFKDDVREVAEGYECGVGIDKFNDIKEGDIFEAFIMEEIKK